MKRTLIIVPTLGRLDRLPAVVENIQDTTPEPHAIVFVVEPHEFMATSDALIQFDSHRVHVLSNRRPGHVGAYNWALERYAELDDWDAWFHGADDLRCHPGWLTKARAVMGDDPVVVGTNDLLSKRVKRGVAATHYLVARAYTDAAPAVPDVEPPHAYFEGYHHMYVETEFIDVARSRGAFRPCLDSIVEHLHPVAGKADGDATYLHAQSRTEQDRELYLDRQAARR